jgi:hypothetical protein
MWLLVAIAAVYAVSGVGLFVTFHHTGQHVWQRDDDEAMREWAARHPRSGPARA